ncbi:Glycosyltransferase involved in cell wall bisynthesis [Alkalibacterium gilvum]|uniref:Glycosyltransferase involved in cell wall bisynthesis n=1 Tax=Alkalibacterium gilvum TaxID=1130080 RepID=A0A1H6RDW2_9LACT|nr:glycosyltransferase family 2 protein [Alkalibacterium gilvum]SEI53991.1 Glycosyltransferase involved in cell wall bisynthesis [Alkalibacterium gilvum]
MSKPLVSIIVPTYNVEKYIKECMDSLLAQTYPNKEIIVLDDASTDKTVSLLEAYTNKIELIKNIENKGQGRRRNQGFKQAKGKYIYFMDADDWLEKVAITALVAQAEKTNAELVRFNGTVFYEDEQAQIKEGNYNFSKTLTHKEVYTGEAALDKNRKTFSPSPCLYLVKKELIDKHNVSFVEGALHEDEYFTTLLFARTQKMTYLNKDYYHRRYRTASTMTEETEEHKLKSFDSYLKVFKALDEELRKFDYSNTQKQFIKRQLLSIYNGLIQSDIQLEMKNQLTTLECITMKDKVFLIMARLKQRFFK